VSALLEVSDIGTHRSLVLTWTLENAYLRKEVMLSHQTCSSKTQKSYDGHD
jgi:hypothetical protein